MPDTEPFWLAIDQGTQSTRACVIDGRGQLVEFHRVPVSLNRVSNLKVEQDGSELVESIWQAINKVISTDNKDKIRGAGLATQRSSVIAWNRQTGKPLSNVISWQDVRGYEFIESFESETVDRIRRTSGLPLSPHYGASKIRWLVDRLRSQGIDLESGDICIGPLSSFLLSNLIDGDGQCQVDHANGGRTQLMSFESRDWDDHSLSCFEIPRGILPETRPTQFEFGILSGTKIPIRVCQGDQTAAVFGGGKLSPGAAHINLGTGGFVLAPIDDLERIRERQTMPLLISLASSNQLRADYILEGTINGAGSAIKWAAEKLGLESVEQNLDLWAKQVTDPPLFFNSVGGIGSPIWNSSPSDKLANRWFDQDSKLILEPPSDRAMVGVLESVVFLVALNLETMRDLEIKISKLRLTGGMAKSRELCQRLADLSGCEIVCPPESESTLVGIARLLGETTGKTADHVEVAETAGETFVPRTNTSLEQRYRVFKRLITRSN